MGPRATNLASNDPEPLISTDGGHIRFRFPFPVLGSLRESSQVLRTAKIPQASQPSVLSDDNRDRSQAANGLRKHLLGHKDSSCVSGLVADDQVGLQGRVKGQASLPHDANIRDPLSHPLPHPADPQKCRLRGRGQTRSCRNHSRMWAQGCSCHTYAHPREGPICTQHVATLPKTYICKCG